MYQMGGLGIRVKPSQKPSQLYYKERCHSLLQGQVRGLYIPAYRLRRRIYNALPLVNMSWHGFEDFETMLCF